MASAELASDRWVAGQSPPTSLQLLCPLTHLSRVVPEETQIFTPTYTMQRDPRYFSNPTAFLPERWTANSSAGIHNTAAFLPFSAGPTICAGKALAMLEMRMLLVWLVQRFEFTMPAGEPGRTAAGWPDTLEDFFAAHKGALPAIVSVRA